ncbi:hypothetical protein B0H10DRAFT_2166208 [Mycena sp. CBHHK59/15]|nr:hypothetical protein B0H10DRAFT_2166208 [Mycena sp. CBHHK59/15]
MTEVNVDWDLLKAIDPVEELDGPVLAEDCDSICPLRSLANHIWIGHVPWQLKDLSFAEKMLITRVRHNRCVVRVASRRGKMSANAIMFATPVVKVYNILLRTRDELSELLAFVFVGPTRPTDEEYVRTPMLVRWDQVKDTLDWLKLNHVDYADLAVSAENIKDLPENGIPCRVD